VRIVVAFGLALLGFTVGRAYGATTTTTTKAPAAPVAVAASPPKPPPLGAGLPVAAPAAVTPHSGTQSIRVDAVNIEGKLYSPQALFIVSRTAPYFGRDAVVPYTLTIAPSADLAPYRVREQAVRAAVPSAGR
jgi:hypothetical protein